MELSEELKKSRLKVYALGGLDEMVKTYIVSKWITIFLLSNVV